jgi:tyrosyl-tRNA synthetase
MAISRVPTATPRSPWGPSSPPDVLDSLRARGFVANVSDEAGLRAAFERGMVTAYCGFDPTARSLHTGHLVSIMLLANLQRAGHRPIALVGGGTGMIGDPSGRSTLRPMLTEAEIASNVANIRGQFAHYLDFSDDRALLANNADWLLPLHYIHFLRDVGRHFTLNQLMQHETYRERFVHGSLSFLELNYAVTQAYDFLHLFRTYDCILQVGGNDQWFNILAGVDLIRRQAGGAAFALTTPLMTTSSGVKMSKSEGNAPWLDPELTSPYDYYQYWRNTEDADVGRFLRLFTFLPLDEIAGLERLEGSALNRAKEVLAFEATRLAHGEPAALAAQATARARFGGAAEAEDSGPSWPVAGPRDLVDLVAETGLAPSKSEAKRLLRGGGVRLGGVTEKADRQVDPSELPALLRVGKRSVRLVRGD